MSFTPITRRRFTGALAIVPLVACGGPVLAAAPIFTPEQFGAAGNGRTDDFAAFAALWAAVSATTTGYVQFGRKRIYRLAAIITAESGRRENDLKIAGCSGLVIDLNGSKIDVRGDFDRDSPTTFGYPGLSLEHCHNVVIRNGELDGNVELTRNSSNASEAGSLASGIRLASCSDVLLHDLHIHHFQVDGIQIRDAGGSSPRKACRNVKGRNVRCLSNARQGMSIVALRQGTFENCEFSWTGFQIGEYPGHSPQAGVDIEPGRDSHAAPPHKMDVDTGEIEFANCRFENNRGPQFVNGGASRLDTIRFRRCHFTVGSGSIAGTDALIFGAPDSSMADCDIDLGSDPEKRLYLGANANPWTRSGNFSFIGNRVRGGGVLLEMYGPGGRKHSGLVRVEQNDFSSTRGAFHKNPVIRNLGAATNLHFRNNRLWVPEQAHGAASARRPVADYRRGTYCSGNRYSTDLRGDSQTYFTVRYGPDVIAVDEHFAGSRPGPGDTIRPNGDPSFDSRTSFNQPLRSN